MMDTLTAYAIGQANRGKPHMVFDWEKAARLIVERNAQSAAAGLAGDWENTGGTILRDGKPVPKDDTYTYLGSTWAVPELQIDGDILDCWRMEKDTPGWDCDTYWPKEALDILESSGQ